MRHANGLSIAALLIMTLQWSSAGAGASGSKPASSGRSLPASGFEVGQIFPGIVLPSAEDRRPVSLARFRGKKTILHIFASW